ncbi:TIGR02680 family protein [Peristeroidobacter soli]|uniref:TIGR02680 family protein n=1 Tax=Peristeroidobacter soli TaxID=2497877 RepID=UPI00389AEC62
MTPVSRPQLPEPMRERWQPLRLGVVEVFHYDSEEFWFHDGHLLLRGNNGTGKSKVLSLTLPFLFDAQLRPSRIEPDGDAGKKMAWNLLMNSYQRRIGYTWIEFGRRLADGSRRYLTLGAGLSAVDGKAQVDSWYFILDGGESQAGVRIGQDLWLTNAQRVVLTRERLRECIENPGWGQVFPLGGQYRRAVDERLFHLGSKRYDALMDTLIQLRQPQLSKKPDEAGLSQALSDALPPMPSELLTDVAQALNQLEEDRNRLEELRQLERAIRQFEQRYRIYAGMLTRRQARELRQAQTGFDNASEERNAAQAGLQGAQQAETAGAAAHEQARQTFATARERLETLQSDPANQDANRLNQAKKDATDAAVAATSAAKQCEEARQKLTREEERSRASSERADHARAELIMAREQCSGEAEAAGTLTSFESNRLATSLPDELAMLSRSELSAAAGELSQAGAQRRQDIKHLEQRHATADRKLSALESLQVTQRERQAEREEALEKRAQADALAEQAASKLVEAWVAHIATLTQLRLDESQVTPQLTAWSARPEGLNPANAALGAAYQQTSLDHARRESALATEQTTQQQRRMELIAERDQLTAGHDAFPPIPATRAPGVREAREGAPFWQLVDFQSHVEPAERAGIEAALEACGLLDAWLAPHGTLIAADGTALLDSHWMRRSAAVTTSLASVLCPAVPEGAGIDAAFIAALLSSVTYGNNDVMSAESWIAGNGRYRLGTLAGAWQKNEAVYIGHTARAQARKRRLAEIARLIDELDSVAADIERRTAELHADRQRSQYELDTAPSDVILREAVLVAASAGQEVARVHQRLEQIESQCRTAEDELQAAREVLLQDATDLQLPSERAALALIGDALDRFNIRHQHLLTAAREWHAAHPEHVAQREREIEARDALEQADSARAEAVERREKALARFETLRSAVGQRVEILQQQLTTAGTAVRSAEADLEKRRQFLKEAGEQRAIASARAAVAETTLTDRAAVRGQAIDKLQRFTDSGLLSAALPELEVPDRTVPWTIDPALTLARRAEQALAHINDDDAHWSRMQHQIGEALTELLRSLSALGHQASSEPNDWGFTVHIQYQNRPERPDTLSSLLADDIAQRSELLSAKEREVLENHLQAEIAAEIQRLMRAADQQVGAINEELHKRPTTTGVRYRLQWRALAAEDGAPAGLEIARERLLHTSSDLWSVEDRKVVGTMLQQQIAAERARADAETSGVGGSLIDQLARALDYRRWHRFRVQRHQDGQWRKLSGPASSGERALGLTVPLFAAIASFYGRGGSPLAPRLMLLDEAFAGIDDSARAHCMGLIREFDLDFVITSEREWACYAELPGVSICQLQRREGVDAVFVSRWTWDGRAKRPERDPDRRFPAP